LIRDARAALQAALRETLADESLAVQAMRPVGGGCISPTARLDTTAGPFFAKWNDDGPADLFLREADGLREMAEARSGLAIPDVIVARGPAEDAPALIVMELLEPAPLDQEALGRGLASLHRRTAPTFGLHVDSYCGSTRQSNEPSASWAEFYGQRRLGALVRAIGQVRGLAAADQAVYERVIERLPSLVPGGAPPALIHGDLWSGNALGSSRGPAIVDPACAYADREMELGMMTLFGGFSDRCLDAYEEAWPLPEDWRQRNGLYQLYHVLNHFLLFGGHYGAQALALARRYA
jgi:protein-ribulosamine 3-kinase